MFDINKPYFKTISFCKSPLREVSDVSIQHSKLHNSTIRACFFLTGRNFTKFVIGQNTKKYKEFESVFILAIEIKFNSL